MKLRHVPNALCFLRMGLVGVLWALAVGQHRVAFVVVLALTYMTDGLDGYLARKYHLQTPFGAKLDTIADNLVSISLLGWVYLLLRELVTEHGLLIAALLGGFLVDIGLQYARFGRRVALHLYSDKVSQWLMALFLVHAFLFRPNHVLMYLAAAAVGYALIEEIALLSTRRDLDETVRSAFSRRFRQGQREEEPGPSAK